MHACMRREKISHVSVAGHEWTMAFICCHCFPLRAAGNLCWPVSAAKCQQNLPQPPPVVLLLLSRGISGTHVFLGSVLGEFISKQQLIWFPPFSVICLSYVKTAFVIYVSLMLTISGYLPVRGNQKRQCESFKLREQTTLAWRWSLLKYGCSSSPCLCSVCLEIHLFPVLLIICTNIAVSWDF